MHEPMHGIDTPIVLTAKERDVLASLRLGPIALATGRGMPNEYRTLFRYKLARRLPDLIVITPLGDDVAEAGT